MAHTLTEVTLEAMQEAIAREIAAQFPAFATVEFDREDEDEKLPLPACLLSFVEAEPWQDGDAGTGQWPALARFEARVIYNRRKTGATPVKFAAVALASWLNLRRFRGIYTDPAQVIECGPDAFREEVEKWATWRVEFVMPAMFGESAWRDGAPIDPDPRYSFAPAVGEDNGDAYAPLLPAVPGEDGACYCGGGRHVGG